MKQGLSWWTGQGKRRNLWKPKFCHSLRKGPAACFLPIPTNHIPLNTLIISSVPRDSKWFLFFRFPRQISVRISLLPIRLLCPRPFRFLFSDSKNYGIQEELDTTCKQNASRQTTQDNETLFPSWQKESWQTSEETSRYVRPERVNKWPTTVTDIWLWWWRIMSEKSKS